MLKDFYKLSTSYENSKLFLQILPIFLSQNVHYSDDEKNDLFNFNYCPVSNDPH